MLVCDSLAKIDRYVEYYNDLMDAYGMFNGKLQSACWAVADIFQHWTNLVVC
jgi:phytoene/squalene synthetase